MRLRRFHAFALPLLLATIALGCVGTSTIYDVKNYLTRGACPDQFFQTSYWQQLDGQDLESTINTGIPQVGSVDYYVYVQAWEQLYAGVNATYAVSINGSTIYNGTLTCTGTASLDKTYILIPYSVMTNTSTQHIRLTFTNPSYPTGGTSGRAINFYRADLLFWPHLCAPPPNSHC